MAATRELEAWLYGRRAGRLEHLSGQLSFTYDATWLESGMAPISQSLPPRAEPYAGEPVHNFFSNLLPEGEVRRHVARRFGISVGNDFGLLEAIGGDCAGAISLMPPGEPPPGNQSHDVRWFTEAELAEVVADLPIRPLFADPEERIRLSLAGAQDKLPVVVREARVGVPLAGAPSTHILKAPIARLDDTVSAQHPA
jgi:serine/threonine-protein kinase HipA